MPTIQQELLQHPRIKGAASFKYLPSNRLFYTAQVRRAGQVDSIAMAYSNVEVGFVELLELRLLAGRSFSLERPKDRFHALVLNRAATQALGFASPSEAIDAEVGYSHSAAVSPAARVIGVVEDFHFESLHHAIQPMVMNYAPWEWAFSYSGIRIAPDNQAQTLAFIEDTWSEFVPEFPIEWHFLDADFERIYRDEERLSALLAGFAALAIGIACLGVLALTAFAGERRTKEIGVRKTLGASEAGIVALLAREFAILASLANLLAWPLAYLAMDRWLESFAYRTEMAWWVFALGSALVLVCALLAALHQAVRAAHINPVDALRYE
jgi:putative ABC transport system permease protein